MSAFRDPEEIIKKKKKKTFIEGKVAEEILKANLFWVVCESFKQPGNSMAECFTSSATQWAGHST